MNEGFGDEDSYQSVSLDQHHYPQHRDSHNHHHAHHSLSRALKQPDCGDPELNEIATKLRLLAAADSDAEDWMEGEGRDLLMLTCFAFCCTQSDLARCRLTV